MNQRLSQAQRKFVEERTLQTSLEDEKQAVQSQLDALQKEKDRLLAENKQLKSKADTLERIRHLRCEKKAASLETRAASLDAKNSAALRASHQGRRRIVLPSIGSQKQTFQTLQEREKELKQLTVDSRRKYDQCAEHNARLYTIAEELIRKYESKGVVKHAP